jgi:predicted HTH domain antitoxin
MPITIEVSDEILKAIPTINEEAIQGLIELGAKQMRIEEALAIFKEGKISIWRASKIAGLPLREMIAHASARGFKPFFDEDMITEELG